MVDFIEIQNKYLILKIRQLSFGLLLAVMGCLPARSQFVELKTLLDTNQILIGEQFHLDIEILQPSDVNIIFPEIKDTLISSIEVLESYPQDTIAEGENLKISQRHRLTSFDSGFYEIPPLKFLIKSGQWSDSIESNPMYLMVHSVAVDSLIYDVKAPIHMPVSFLEVFPFVAGGLRPCQYKNHRGDHQQPDTIRRYMERRYNIPAMEMTSYEILDSWKHSERPDDDLSAKLNRLLNLADLVKFAKEKPIASDNEENLDRAYEFVKKTAWVQKTEEEKDV